VIKISYVVLFVVFFAAILICIKQVSASTARIKKIATFPVSKPFHEGYLKVSPIHELWYAEYGNPVGTPVIVLHGGPGGGCNDDDMKFFDPDFWRIILLDQRGAKRSRPFGELKDNTTQDLISDLEELRKHLKIDKWLIFGGSWGSTLGLAYGEEHPENVLGFILRGIFLGKNEENLNLWYGMRDTFPEVWQEFNDFIPEAEQGDLVSAYHRLIMNDDPGVAIPAARSFFKYDITCSFLKLSPEDLQKFMANDLLVLGVSRTFIHYSTNKFFIKDNQIIDNIGKIYHLPLIIVHGRYDTITRAKSAYELHQIWPGSELNFVDAAGHSAMEPQVVAELVNATEKIKKWL